MLYLVALKLCTAYITVVAHMYYIAILIHSFSQNTTTDNMQVMCVCVQHHIISDMTYTYHHKTTRVCTVYLCKSMSLTEFSAVYYTVLLKNLTMHQENKPSHQTRYNQMTFQTGTWSRTDTGNPQSLILLCLQRTLDHLENFQCSNRSWECDPT